MKLEAIYEKLQQMPRRAGKRAQLWEEDYQEALSRNSVTGELQRAATESDHCSYWSQRTIHTKLYRIGNAQNESIKLRRENQR